VKSLILTAGILKISCCSDCPINNYQGYIDECSLGVDIFDSCKISDKCPLPDYKDLP
jgi:hypothetical protein